MITVNGDPAPWTPGMTVRDVLKDKNYKFPLLVITLDEVHVPPKAYDTTEVSDGAILNVLHLMSGG
jgi:sulfur carrier protein